LLEFSLLRLGFRCLANSTVIDPCTHNAPLPL
jgi:hypothetical protein